jgi:hypothetical protein
VFRSFRFLQGLGEKADWLVVGEIYEDETSEFWRAPGAGLVSPDFTGDNRFGAPQRSNQCGDCWSTQKSVHNSGINDQFARPSSVAERSFQNFKIADVVCLNR